MYMFDMPLLRLETTVVLSEEKRKTLLSSLSKTIAGTIGKPEQYMMVTIDHSAILMSGKAGEAAFVEIRSIGGLGGEVNRKLSQQVCKQLNESLAISPERVYLNFIEVDAQNWGWNDSTFG